MLNYLKIEASTFFKGCGASPVKLWVSNFLSVCYEIYSNTLASQVLRQSPPFLPNCCEKPIPFRVDSFFAIRKNGGPGRNQFELFQKYLSISKYYPQNYPIYTKI